MVKVREKCWSTGCNGKVDIFPLYMRGYDKQFKRVNKETERRDGTIRIMNGYVCPICKDIIWRDKR